jgi:hypothetical protein
MTPGEIHFPRTRIVTYRLQLITGNAPERLLVIAAPPSYSGPPFPRSFDELIRQRRNELRELLRHRLPLLACGSPIEPVGGLEIAGAGKRISDPLFPMPPDIPAVFSPNRPCERGYPIDRRAVALQLPPQAAATVTGRYRTGRSAPWPGTDYRLTFLVFPLWNGGRSQTTHAPRGRRYLLARPIQPRLTGTSGVKITLRTSPELRVRRGREVRVFGRTDPPVRRQWMRLSFRAAPEWTGPIGPTKLLAQVRTDAEGRFDYRWRPGYGLNYELWATYRRQRTWLTSDESCSQVIAVG